MTPSPVIEEFTISLPNSSSHFKLLPCFKSISCHISIISLSYVLFCICEFGLTSFKNNYLFGIHPMYFLNEGMLNWNQQSTIEIVVSFLIFHNKIYSSLLNPFVNEGIIDCILYLSCISYGMTLLMKESFTQMHFIYLFIFNQFSMNCSLYLFSTNQSLGSLRYYMITITLCSLFTLLLKYYSYHNSYSFSLLWFGCCSFLLLIILIPFSSIHCFLLDGFSILINCINIACFYPWKEYIHPSLFISSLTQRFPLISPLFLLGILLNCLYYILWCIIYMNKQSYSICLK